MNTAEQLADDLENLHSRTLAAQRAAAELRRLAAENERLKAVCTKEFESVQFLDGVNVQLREMLRQCTCLLYKLGRKYERATGPCPAHGDYDSAMKEQP